ncbi:hypothetical protein J2T58_000753 [Methanocalculus alkaliphilus]|uniref:hypothetical protein n=1 Tax=Methanocalculus alkaliphilus TaxID=768730 RepID=UPI00209E78DC|nr:hypothetical protein [Methanocalculus alkaliphilus]MCP1714908.1 hypothetical protein [Methanocalculus alkaliphilus]
MSADAVAEAFKAEGIEKEIQCEMAFAISEKYGIEKFDISRYCNKNGIKIRGCQLGCFK